MSKVVVLEVLIATPPTIKCEETIEVLEEVVRRFPDETRLVVFRRGIDFMPEEMWDKQYVTEEETTPKEASLQMRTIINKGRAVPTVVINDELICSFDVPNVEDLDKKVKEILGRAK